VVAEMGIDHQQVFAADARDAAAFFRPDVNGDRFAEGISVADLQPRVPALVFQILRRGADDRVGEEDVSAADRRLPEDGDVVEQPAARADLHVRPDDAERPDLDVLGNLRFLIDDRLRRNLGLLTGEKLELEEVPEPGAAWSAVALVLRWHIRRGGRGTRGRWNFEQYRRGCV